MSNVQIGSKCASCEGRGFFLSAQGEESACSACACSVCKGRGFLVTVHDDEYECYGCYGDKTSEAEAIYTLERLRIEAAREDALVAKRRASEFQNEWNSGLLTHGEVTIRMLDHLEGVRNKKAFFDTLDEELRNIVFTQWKERPDEEYENVRLLSSNGFEKPRFSREVYESTRKWIKENV